MLVILPYVVWTFLQAYEHTTGLYLYMLSIVYNYLEQGMQVSYQHCEKLDGSMWYGMCDIT